MDFQIVSNILALGLVLYWIDIIAFKINPKLGRIVALLNIFIPIAGYASCIIAYIRLNKKADSKKSSFVTEKNAEITKETINMSVEDETLNLPKGMTEISSRAFID